MTIYIVWEYISDSKQEDRVITVCDTLENARIYRDKLIGSNYITQETINYTLGYRNIE